MKTSGLTILDAISDTQLFSPYFHPAATWAAWRTFLGALFALPPTADDLARYRRHTGRTSWPTTPAREAWLACGRRAGKSRAAALIAVFLACFRDWTSVLAPGEVGTVALIAAARRQARTLLRYVRGLMEHPMLKPYVEAETADGISLTNRTVIEVHTASFRSVRGYTLVCALLDEVSTWRNEDSANPDSEIVAALRPGLATTKGLLLGLSNPYARKGELFRAHEKHAGRDGDPVLWWSADTLSMNPSLDPGVIEDAFDADPVAAWSEFGRDGQIRFRSDVATFVPSEVVDAAVTRGVFERQHVPGTRAVFFVDPASGSGTDSFTLAAAHAERDGKAVLDLLKEWKPPFSPAAVVEEVAAIIKARGGRSATGDRYAAGIIAEMFSKAGVKLEHSEASRSDIYLNLLPLLTAGRARLLDGPRLRSQLISLERRTSRNGRDSVDAGSAGHEDVANAAAGALVLAAKKGGRRDCGITLGTFSGARDAAPAAEPRHDDGRRDPWRWPGTEDLGDRAA